MSLPSEYIQLKQTNLKVSRLCLGTWAFGNDAWWGAQADKDSFAVLDFMIGEGINFVDTAPVYGRGYSEEVIGRFLKQRRLREKVVLATKVGLSWKDKGVYPNLKRERILEEIEDSRRRLQTDYIDLYQAHWPDESTPIRETAETMFSLYQKGIIKAVGVSNFNCSQMEEFLNYCPIHTLQPPYNMFKREIEAEIMPFCQEHDINIISYIPLHSGILTGKFFFDGVPLPSDIGRRRHIDLSKERFDINKEALAKIKAIADKYGKTLAQLSIRWVLDKGVSSALVGTRKISQAEENIQALGWELNAADLEKIDEILLQREEKIKNLENKQ